MSAVVGIDLSSHALDLVKLQEDSQHAEWIRCELAGNTAWDRTLDVREAMWRATGDSLHRWLEDVYLVAIEAPYGRGQAGTLAILNRVVGAVAASLPAKLQMPERCWLIPPHEWRTGLGLKHNAKPTDDDLDRVAPDRDISFPRDYMQLPDDAWQNARDAYCLALYSRDLNARAVEKALTA